MINHIIIIIWISGEGIKSHVTHVSHVTVIATC